MTADALSGGFLRRLRYVLPLLLVVLLALAPATPARAAENPCPPVAVPDVPGALTELLAFVEAYRSGATVPTQEEVQARLAQLLDLVDYLLAQQLTDGEVAFVQDQARVALTAENVPPQHVETAVVTLGDLLNSETPLTAEQALAAIVTAVTPYLLETYTQEQIDFIHTYLKTFLPAPGASECPAPPAGTPQPTTTAVPVANASPAETSTSGSLANTGIDPILMLGIVAIAMIAGGLALEAGQRRPARNRDDYL